MRRLGLWLDAHCTEAEKGVFRTAAERSCSTIKVIDIGSPNLAAQLHAAAHSDVVMPVTSGRELLDCIRSQSGYFDHIVIAGHGGTTWLLDDEHGVTTKPLINPDQVSVNQLASAIKKVTKGCVDISLAACMCSRSPTWFLRWKLGDPIGSDWGPRAYLQGGQASFSARLRDYLHWYGRCAHVRGHRASGHATALALLAEHSGNAGTACDTLFQRCFPDLEPTWWVRRKWTRLVTGDLAQRWLMFDDSVVAEIKERW